MQGGWNKAMNGALWPRTSFQNSARISDSEEKSRLLLRLAASPREDKLARLGCPEKRPRRGVDIACCIRWKQCAMPPAPSSSSLHLHPHPPHTHSSLWIEWPQKAAAIGYFEEKVTCQSGSSYYKWVWGQGWEASPTCFSSLCSFVHLHFILSILIISLLKREQRFLLNYQATKNCVNLWVIPGNPSAVRWLCSFHGWRLFRQKKRKCKILATDIAIEREMLLRGALNVITS